MRKFYAKYKPYYRENLALAIPVMISQVGQVLVQTSDSIIVGHFVGTIALAAVSLVNSIFILVLVIGIGIAYGSTPLISRENGSGNFADCGKILSASLTINTITGILLFLIVYFGSQFSLIYAGQAKDVVQLAKPFLVLMGFSIVPLMIFNTFKQFAEGLGFTKQAMQISIWGNVLNICLGIIFVKGLFGVSPMGIRGVGFSTLVDRSVMAIAMGIFIFKSHRFKIYLTDFKLFSITRKLFADILSIGAPIAAQYACEVSAFSGAALLMGMIGEVQLAAHQVAINLASLTFMGASGIAAAAAIKSGTSLGSGNFIDLKKSAQASYHIVLVLMSCTALIFLFGNRLIPWIYTSDLNVINFSAQLLVLAAAFQLFDGTQVVGLGILRGIGDVKIPALITFLAYWIFGLPIAYYLGIKNSIGPVGIWIGLTMGLLVAAILLYYRFKKLSARLIASSALAA